MINHRLIVNRRGPRSVRGSQKHVDNGNCKRCHHPYAYHRPDCVWMGPPTPIPGETQKPWQVCNCPGYVA
jgi:hypothetical protein